MCKLPQNIIFHRLKNCVNGLSECNYNNLDVSKIVNLEYSKRLFCINDKKYPWTLGIVYHEPEIHINSLIFTFPLGNIGISKTPVNIEEYKIIRKRYASKSDIIQEIRNINYKINKLKKYQQSTSDKIIQQMEEMPENILKKDNDTYNKK